MSADAANTMRPARTPGPDWRRLLLSRARMWRRTLLPGPRRGRSAGAAWFGLALMLALGTLVTLALVGVFSSLPAAGPGAPEIARTVLALILGTAIAGLIVFDLHDAVTTLVADSDLSLLRRAPIPPGAMLALKLLDAFPRTAPAVAGIALPAAVAYWAVYPPAGWAWLVLPGVILALWAMPLGVGVAAALVLLSWIPARRAREGLAALATLALLAVWIVNALLLPRLAAMERATGDWAHALLGLQRVAAMSPGWWVAQAIAAPSEGDAGQALVALAVVAAASLLSLALARLAAGRLLDSIQARVAVPSAPSRARRRQRPLGVPGAAPRPLLHAMLARDARLYVRDWGTLADVFTATALWALLPLVAAPLFEVDSSQVARLMLLALTVGLGYEIAARAFPLERRGIAWMRLAPVPGRSWVLARYASAAALSLALFSLGAVATIVTLGVRGREVVEMLALALPALALALATGLWTGANFGDPEWRSARGMLTLPGRLAATALLLLQATGWTVLATLAAEHRDALPPFAALWVPAVFVALPAVLLLSQSASRLQRPAS